MQSYFVIGIVSLLVAGLTLFSGFGLGTILMPAFALFFPLEIAIAATAIVHLANNIFKGLVAGKKADFKITLLFALPAAAASFGGAWLLDSLSAAKPVVSYTLNGKIFSITVFKLIIGSLMALFALLELFPGLSQKQVSPRYIPLGGLISGFFGGLSGHQGAFRAVFLLKAGLSKEAFIGTTVLSAIIVDLVRIMVYGMTFISRNLSILTSGQVINHMLVATLAAFLGVFAGARLLKKVTLRFIQITVGILLLLIAIFLTSGLI
jgi:hypothetical protein